MQCLVVLTRTVGLKMLLDGDTGCYKTIKRAKEGLMAWEGVVATIEFHLLYTITLLTLQEVHSLSSRNSLLLLHNRSCMFLFFLFIYLLTYMNLHRVKRGGSRKATGMKGSWSTP